MRGHPRADGGRDFGILLQLEKICESIWWRYRLSISSDSNPRMHMQRMIPLVFLVAAIGASIIGHQADGNELRTEKGKAGHIRVKNDSATMYADENYFITQSRGLVGSEGIPAEIRTGDTVRVKDRVLNVKHIFWTRYLDRYQYGRDFLVEAGDVSCVLVETEGDLPYGDEYRNRLWISVKQCEIIKNIGYQSVIFIQ